MSQVVVFWRQTQKGQPIKAYIMYHMFPVTCAAQANRKKNNPKKYIYIYFCTIDSELVDATLLWFDRWEAEDTLRLDRAAETEDLFKKNPYVNTQHTHIHHKTATQGG